MVYLAGGVSAGMTRMVYCDRTTRKGAADIYSTMIVQERVDVGAEGCLVEVMSQVYPMGGGCG